ncbi:hypothetical protein Rhe02_09730 [Rhizocola hellebori]|uniref:Uncharacterized protein n=1 Tax=Rhizocola hellebori TaxID=1392758 RepID=A0A8J3VE09_9ACTN|nr:hypothetical protein [Rhizocola hellebori]GIH02906.1 hypothetical protein Rhe02_09730 [Rhizocola hellebori]
MYLTHPALRRIAAATGDVWPDLMWRFHTYTRDARGEVATLLHETSLRFNDSSNLVGQVLGRAADDIARLQRELATHGQVHAGGTDRRLADTLAAIERHTVLEQQLLRQYDAWRSHVDSPAAGGDFRLLVKAGDASWGVAEFRRHDRDQWHVLPDEEAATRFGIGKHARRAIGAVARIEGGYQLAAYHDPEFPHPDAPERSHQLPVFEDLQAAARCLLRWWAYREADNWDGRYPHNFAPDELAALSE